MTTVKKRNSQCTFNIVAGSFGLVQGLIWSALSLVCILCHFGQLLEPEDNTSYFGIIYYFFLYRTNVSNSALFIEPLEFFIFMWCFFVMSLIWTFVSGFLIWAGSHSQWHLFTKLNGSFALVTGLISIIDVVLLGLLAADLNSFAVAGISDDILISYEIVMGITARGGLFWLLNVILMVVSISYAIKNAKEESKGPPRPIINGFEQDNVNWLAGSVNPTFSASESSVDDFCYYNGDVFYPAVTPPKLYNNPTAPEEVIYNAPQRFAGITKNGRKSPPTTLPRDHVDFDWKNEGSPIHLSSQPPLFIPEPDYTPPGSPRSVLRANSSYF